MTSGLCECRKPLAEEDGEYCTSCGGHHRRFWRRQLMRSVELAKANVAEHSRPWPGRKGESKWLANAKVWLAHCEKALAEFVI